MGRTKGSKNKPKKMCEWPGCENPVNAHGHHCDQHTCQYSDCTAVVDEEAEYENCCPDHMCEYGDCTAMIDEDAEDEDCCRVHMCKHSACTLIVDEDSHHDLCTWHEEQRQENEAAEAEVENEHWSEFVQNVNALRAGTTSYQSVYIFG